VSLAHLGSDECTLGYTGADLAALVREASLQLLKEVMANKISTKNLQVELRHFEMAIHRIRPSVSEMVSNEFSFPEFCLIRVFFNRTRKDTID
jgi:SpoVK/Ycf46/Vps4 family AAA+-type ATPase